MKDEDIVTLLVLSEQMGKFSRLWDCTNYPWYVESGWVMWNKEGSVDDLAKIVGDTYSLELSFGEVIETDSFTLFEDCFVGDGSRCDAVFRNKYKFDVDAYWKER